MGECVGSERDEEEQRRSVRRRRAARQVRVRQLEGRGPELARIVLVHVRVEQRSEPRLVQRRVRVPGQAGGGEETPVAHAVRLVVAAVAPIRRQEAARTRARAVHGRFAQVRQRVARTTGETLPARRARAHPELEAAGREVAHVLRERMAGVVAPLQRDEVLRQLGHELGPLQHDVAPELHPVPTRRDERVHAAQVLQVDALDAALVARGLRTAAPEVERLVEADVEALRAKTRQQLVVKVLEQRDRGGVRQVERVGLLVQAERVVDALGHFGQTPVARVLQPAVEVPEALLVRRQLDPEGRAAVVERAHLGRRQSVGVAPDLLVARVRERVLDVELQVIDLPRREATGQRVEFGRARDARARHVEQHAARREPRAIVDRERGDRERARSLLRVQIRELRERRQRMARAGVIRRGDARSRRIHDQPVRARAQRSVARAAHARVGPRARRARDGRIERAPVDGPRPRAAEDSGAALERARLGPQQMDAVDHARVRARRAPGDRRVP